MLKPSRRTLLAASAALAATPATAQQGRDRDALLRGFTNPPDSAKPRVWWHWMDGNITREGIAQDLAWMERVGIGGVQNFDAALATPQIVGQRLVYMSAEWKRAFRYAVTRAESLGLEFAIAASPGWSETGGPWVAPQDGMKKLVWTETIIEGGSAFDGPLATPSGSIGPYQNLSSQSVLGLVTPDLDLEFYRDFAVIAVPAAADDRVLTPARATMNDAPIDVTLLNGDLSTGAALPAGAAGVDNNIRLDFSRAQTVRSATFCGSHASGGVLKLPPIARLEASSDGQTWRALGAALLGAAPVTLSFEPVRARSFRLVFVPLPVPGVLTSGFTEGVNIDEVLAEFSSDYVTAEPKLVQFELFANARVNQFEKKAGFEVATNYHALDEGVGSDVDGVAPEAVLDISAHLDEEGRLRWTPPPGRWKVLRLGYSLTGKKNHPAPPEATGLEVDKYDAAAVETYLNTYLDMYKDAVGRELMGARGVRALLTDSTEVGPSNWTPRLPEHFQRLRGYDLTPWLPALTGVIVGSRAQSDAFLFDFRATLSELHASEHYGTVARVAHERGLIVYGESLEGGRATLGDDLDMRAHADIPMAALWTYGRTPAAGQIADARGAASIAHVKGRTFVACESLTSGGQPWNHAPRDLQPMIDVIFSSGVNRPVIHTSVHQPAEQAPGVSLGMFGQYFTRHETWAEMARPWIDYISRSSYLLQQGRNVADVAIFYGEDIPIGSQAGSHPQDLPTHHAYDFVSAQSLLADLRVESGELVSVGGARYRVLYLNPFTSHMTLPVLRQLAAFVEAGAIIVGEAPSTSPALRDDSGEFEAIVSRLWSGRPITEIGLGRVFAGRDVEGALASIGVPPAVAYDGGRGSIHFVHRTVDDGAIFFVSNRTDEPQHRDIRFRITGKAPELWRADRGTTEPAGYRFDGAHTVIPLELGPYESLFVVFRAEASEPARIIRRPRITRLAEITGAWEVAFQSGRGAPSNATLPALASLSENADPAIKYFSGIATYTKTFELQARPHRGDPLWLDLGVVADVAEVRVNGRLAGTVWRDPNRLDIGPFVRSGRNRLEIKVANVWKNRLIGDQQPGAERVAFTTTPTYTADAPLRPSGLIGPVALLSVEP